MYRIGFGLTSSYCTIEKILVEIQKLVDLGYDVVPIVSDTLIKYDTRFQKVTEIKERLEKITGNKIVDNIVEAEKFGPFDPLDLMVIAPMTGNSLSKFADSNNDNAVLLAAKATLRNQKPIIIGIATNDGLGLSGVNILKLMNSKNIFFVPFGQDNYLKKPNSLVAKFEFIEPTIRAALASKQFQPVIMSYD